MCGENYKLGSGGGGAAEASSPDGAVERFKG